MATIWTDVIDGAATTVGAVKGDTGATGPQGPQGLTGPQGPVGSVTLADLSGHVATAIGASTSRSLAARFADTVNVRDFGAVGDGVANDAAALQAAIDAAATAGGGTVYLPRGTYLFSSALSLKSGVTLTGAGMGLSILKIGSGIALTTPAITNPNVSLDRTTRTDRNLGFKNLTIDGSARAYIAYLTDPVTGLPISDPVTNKTRNPAYNTRGIAVRFKKTQDARVENVELYNHQSLGITDEGCQGTVITGCLFRNNGKVDDTSPAVYVAGYGTLTPIVGITNANPAVVTTLNSHGFANGSTVWLTGIRGMSEITDGAYTIGTATSNTFTLSGVNSTAYGVFALSATGAASSTFYTPSEDCLITNNVFRDNLRSGIIFSPRGGGILSNNLFANNGESTVFSSNAIGVQILNNRIKKTTLTDIVADGIETNYCGHVKISGNHIEDTDTSGITVQGCYGFEVTNNTIVNPFRTAGLARKYGPFAEHWTGTAVGAGDEAGLAHGDDRKNGLLIMSLGDYATEAGLIQGNTFIEDRNTPLTTSGIFLTKSGTADKVSKISILDNDFLRCGIADQTRLIYYVASCVVPGSTVVRGNRGHASQFPVTLPYYTSVGTGEVSFDFGFTPSMLLVEAISASASAYRRSSAHVSRSGNSNAFGTIGSGIRVALDALNSTPHPASVEAYNNNVVYIADGGVTNLNVCKFSAWTNSGVKLNWTTHATAVRVLMTAFP